MALLIFDDLLNKFNIAQANNGKFTIVSVCTARSRAQFRNISLLTSNVRVEIIEDDRCNRSESQLSSKNEVLSV